MRASSSSFLAPPSTHAPLIALAAALSVIASAAPAANGAVSISDSGPGGATLVFTLDSYEAAPVGDTGYFAVWAPGLTLSGHEGAPALPVESIPLIAPHGAAVKVSVLSEDLVWLDGIVPAPWPSERIEDDGALPHPVADLRPDGSYYAPGAVYPPLSVEVMEAGTLRGHRVVSVLIWPFRFDAGRGGLQVRKKVVARVEFEGGSEALPGPVRSGDRRWEPLLRGLVPNYEQGKIWRRVQAPAGAGDRARSVTVQEFKLRVRDSSLYRVLYEDLAALGLTQGAGVEELRLYERSYSAAIGSTVETEIPIVVMDSDSDGEFEPGDSFVFYGLSYWDRFPEKLGKGARVRPHVYWLSLGGTVGARMGSAVSWGEFADPEVPGSFPETLRLHEDHILNRTPYDPEFHLFWLNPSFADEVLPFEAPSPDPQSPFGVGVRFQSYEVADHAFSLHVNNGLGGTETIISRGVFSSVSEQPAGKPPYTYDSGPIGAAGFLTGGANSLRIVGERLDRGKYVPGLGAFLDWFEISYNRLFEAWNDSVTCTAAASGTPQEIEVKGFSSPDLLVFDVTDLLSPRAFSLDGRNVVEAGDGTYTLLIRGEFTQRRRIAASAIGALRPVGPGDIELDAPSDLRSEGAGADYVVVAYDDFADETAPLAALREEQGFHVAVANASDVYDEFGDGYKSVEAIKNYFAYAYNNWSAAYGLLVGDANEDRENVLTGPQGDPTPPDFVPSYLMRQDGVPTASYGPELVNSDSWYGVHLDGDSGDWMPDMFIGRLPAGSAKEARDMVDKVVRYESYGAADGWRSRGLLVADDDYSTSTFSNQQYRRSSTEAQYFEPISERLSLTLQDGEMGVPGFAAPIFRLRSYIGKYPEDPKKDFWPDDPFILNKIKDYTRVHATPALVDTMSMGWLFVNYQGHGNEEVWAHETLFASYTNFSQLDDVSSLGNTNRPFVLFAYSCHIADFDDKREGDYGDCIAERMLLLPEAGAVAAFASAGYEYLSTSTFNEPVLEAFLLNPPVEDEADEVHIRLGPAIAKGEIAYLLASPQTNKHPLMTFLTLGDPAMRIDAAPPRIQAALGDSVLSDGALLKDPTGAGALALRFEIRDEVAVDSTSISLKEIWHRTEGQDSTYVVPPSEYAVTRARQGRLYSLDYTVHLLPASMELVAGAVDRNGRLSSLTLRAVLSAVWEADGRPLSQDDLVGAIADLSVRVSSPVPIEGNVLSVAVDGVGSSSFAARQADLDGMEWELTAPDFVLEDGSHSLSLIVDGRPVKTVAVRVDTRFRFASLIPYPSPCDEKGTTFFYELTTTGDVEIAEIVMKIYSVSGRLVAELRDPNPSIGRGSIHWPAVDGHGDRVANGIYICRAVASGAGGGKATVVGKVAVAR